MTTNKEVKKMMFLRFRRNFSCRSLARVKWAVDKELVEFAKTALLRLEVPFTVSIPLTSIFLTTRLRKF